MPINSGFAATENTISTTKISNPSAAAVTSSRDTGLAPSESVRAPTIKHQELVAPNVTQSHATSERTNAAETVSSSKGKNPSLTITSTPAGTGSIGGDTMNPSHHETHTPKPHGTTSHNQEDKLGSVSAEKGTGEIYIKSSGTIADGGDFDAARAGAGREADRMFPFSFPSLFHSLFALHHINLYTFNY